MTRATKAKRASCRKLKNYAELGQKLTSLRESSSSSSKGKGKGKAKAKASPSNAIEKTLNEMEAIELWVMGQKKISVESEVEIEALLEISAKCGKYECYVKVKGGNPQVKENIRKKAREGNLKF